MLTLDFIAKLDENAKNDVKKGGDDPEKKTSCFGGFYSSPRVKLASKLLKIPKI